MTRKRTLWIGGMALVAGLFLLGCSNKHKTTSDPTSNSSVPTNASSTGTVAQDDSPGRKIFDNQNCKKCHMIGGGGGAPTGGMPGGMGGMGKGPNLAGVGNKRDLTYIKDHIRSARSHRQSQMPDYPPDKLTDADLKVLSEYLASLK